MEVRARTIACSRRKLLCGLSACNFAQNVQSLGQIKLTFSQPIGLIKLHNLFWIIITTEKEYNRIENLMGSCP
jgi:hypothetical protein